MAIHSSEDFIYHLGNKLKEYQNHTALAAVQQQEIIDQQNAAKAKLEAEQ